MKKFTVFYISGIMALCSCGNQNNATNQKTENTPHREPNIITKHIPIGAEFTHLTSVSGANIVYTQGDYALDITGDSAIIQHLEADFDANILTLSLANERNSDLNAYEGKQNVTINVSAPNLQCVSICSSGDFISKGMWKGEKLEFGIIGSGNFYCDSIDCNIFDMQSTGRGQGEFAHIKAERIHFASTSETGIKADIDTDLLLAENQSIHDFVFTGKINKKEIYETKRGKILFK